MRAIFLLSTVIISLVMGYAILLAVNQQLSVLNGMLDNIGLGSDNSLLQQIADMIKSYPYRPYYG